MTSGWSDILGLTYLAFGVYLVIGGILATRASGFRFYCVARSVGGVPLILYSLTCLVFGAGDTPLYLLLNMGWLLPIIWERLRQSEARELHPELWSNWENKTKHDHRIKRFFYFGVIAPYRLQDRVDESTMSSSKFWIAMAFMTVVAFTGVALIVLILLGRRGS